MADIFSPMVSVLMITYNHEKFISEAIEGVLKQNFSFELIICDDHSSDNTVKICEEYSSNDPRIRLNKNTVNLGASKNFTKAISLVQGKYIALCEGDDFWTDNNKLKKQVDFLEQNEDFAICFHDVMILRDNKFERSSIVYNKDVFDIVDLAKENFIHTPSVVCRKIQINELPDYFTSLHVGDYILHMYAAKRGKIKYLSENMAVYRIHEAGSWSTKNDIFIYEKIEEYLLKLYKDNFDNKIKSIFKLRLVGTYQNLLSKKKDNKYLLKIAKLNPVLAGKLFLKSLVS